MKDRKFLQDDMKKSPLSEWNLIDLRQEAEELYERIESQRSRFHAICQEISRRVDQCADELKEMK